MTERLAAYANAHGRPSGWPYYSLDAERSVTAKEWDALRYRWRHAHGLTNVWSRRPPHDTERLKGTLRCLERLLLGLAGGFAAVKGQGFVLIDDFAAAVIADCASMSVPWCRGARPRLMPLWAIAGDMARRN
jgi:hypothetical protein